MAKVGIPHIQNKIHKKADKLNNKLHNKSDKTFSAKLFESDDLELNFTTTQAPVFNSTENTIELHFDGLFFDQSAKSTHVTANKVFPKRNTLNSN